MFHFITRNRFGMSNDLTFNNNHYVWRCNFPCMKKMGLPGQTPNRRIFAGKKRKKKLQNVNIFVTPEILSVLRPKVVKRRLLVVCLVKRMQDVLCKTHSIFIPLQSKSSCIRIVVHHKNLSQPFSSLESNYVNQHQRMTCLHSYTKCLHIL